MSMATPEAGSSTRDADREERYTHGHHESVLRSHLWRTAENSAGYLLPHLRPGQSLLDVGCGPGTVTIDLARRLAPGTVIGLDNAAVVLEVARESAASADLPHLSFQEGDAYHLPFEDASFDVVHAHQVLQHLVDPIAALREMKRVARPGGIVAVRDSDFSAMTWYPPSAALDEWLALYHEVTQANHAEADAGRRLLSWALEAGFDPAGVIPSAGVWCYSTPDDRSWWGNLWADRSVASDFARQAVEHHLADDVALEHLADGWREWSVQPDGWFAILHGEIIARA